MCFVLHYTNVHLYNVESGAYSTTYLIQFCTSVLVAISSGCTSAVIEPVVVALVYWLQSVCWTCVRHRWCPGGPDLLSSAQTKMNIWTCREKSSSRYMLSSFTKRICLNVEMYLHLYLKRITRSRYFYFSRGRPPGADFSRGTQIIPTSPEESKPYNLF